MYLSHTVGHLWFMLVVAALLAAGGCETQVTVEPSPLAAEQREQLASDLSRLDQICWFLIIERSQSSISSGASVLCKAKNGGVSDISAHAKGRTVSEAAARALVQLEEQIPSAKLQMGSSDQISRLKQTIIELEQLGARSWQFELNKNNGWTVVVKARREDELFSRSVNVDHGTLDGAVREALVQLQKSEKLPQK